MESAVFRGRSCPRQLRAPLALLAGALLAGGCGSSGSSSSSSASSTPAASSTSSSTSSTTAAPTPKTVTHAQLVSDADAICVRVKAYFAANPLQSSSYSEIAALSARNAGVEAQAVKDLLALVPPASINADWQRFLADRQILAVELKELSEAADGEDQAGVVRLEKSKAAVQKTVAKLARGLGVKQCATFD
jgi:hypothetical protein